ncbi:helix-hairpin-helix domain-containing protein [Pseudomonas arcuscaelestis]|uniref:helix-hairpin-helix domain-containing protein n=1 Tax=Pseudomonas arcuscaelestis TaxID=2710591 RepID=UPI001F4141AB|nr:helix-hairpin-helix domain-containing protein [Pseudomonas arcuscaelestis]
MTEQLPDGAQAPARERGTLVDIVFRDPAGPWSICTFRRPDLTIFSGTGNFGNAILFEDYILYGQRIPDIDGGDFDVSQFSSMPPASIESLVGYLSTLTGVPRSATSKLVQFFGEDLIPILDQSPQRLIEAGISVSEASALGKVWAEQRSEQLALAQIDVEGIPPAKLATLQRRLGYAANLSEVLREDPYLLYVHFEDILFSSALNLAKRFGVTNNTLSAVKGAVVAVLRREAWLGHSYVEGRPLIEAVMKMLRLTRDEIRPLIGKAVTNLAVARVVHANNGQLQLLSLYEAEKALATLLAKWVAKDCVDSEDLVPTERMAAKLLKPLELDTAVTKSLTAGLRSLLAERFALIQCETLADQLKIIEGLHLILRGFGTDVIYSAYTTEMADELNQRLDDAMVVNYSALIGIDPKTGVPAQHSKRRISADVLIVAGADSLGVEEMLRILRAVPEAGRIFMLGAVKDLPAHSIGQPFAEIAQGGSARVFQASFWLPARSLQREASRRLWSGTLKLNAENFDPSQAISWLPVPQDMIAETLPIVVREFAKQLEVDPLLDIRVVVPAARDAAGGDLVGQLSAALAMEFTGEAKPVDFHGKGLFKGLPFVVRQSVSSTIHPPFSVFTAAELNAERLVAKDRAGGSFTLSLAERLDVFQGAVMTPKLIRGRVYEVIVLVVSEGQHDLFNTTLLSTLLNSAKTTVLIVGALDGVLTGYTLREPTVARSLLPNRMNPDVDQISPT